MKQINVEIKKTARYFQIGEITDRTEEVWFVLHGYGQLANYFLKKFNMLDNGQRVIIAPEGLHRFYWEGYSGKVVASWMTKEDRLSDVKDYVQFLDNVYSNLKIKSKVRTKLLGFSQGTATACRWAVLGDSKFDELILWSGTFPRDINYNEHKQELNTLNVKLVIGEQDEFYSMEEAVAHQDWVTRQGVNVEFSSFSGGHAIDEETLLNMV